MAKFPSEAESDRIISGMRWMGILSSEKATVARGNLLDTLCTQLEKLMSFKPGERDLVILQHKFVVEWSDQKTVRSDLSHSAIHRFVYIWGAPQNARCANFPCLATRLIFLD